jgi:hypothetical protein
MQLVSEVLVKKPFYIQVVLAQPSLWRNTNALYHGNKKVPLSFYLYWEQGAMILSTHGPF